MSRSNRLPLAIVSGVVFLAAAAWLARQPLPLPPVPGARLAAVCLACMALYLGSHLLRATRLAIIGLSIQRTSFRTLALLQLSVAPWSMILPFKLDELVRINELRSIDGSLARAAITVVIDRSMDGPALLAITAYLAMAGETRIALVTGVIGAGLVAVTIGFFAASNILQLVQRYIFIYHFKPRALHMLRLVHQLRLLARLGRETILAAAPILVLCTIGIWCLEILAIGVLLHTITPAAADPQSVVSATLVRANAGWQAMIADRSLGFPAALATKLFTAGLLLVWLPAIWLYCRRRDAERRHGQFLHRLWSARAVSA